MADRVVNLNPHKNYAQVPGVVFEHAGLDAYGLAVYTALLFYSFRPSMPKQGELAEHLQMSRFQVNKVMRELEEKGLLTRQGNTNGMTYILTDYHMWWSEIGSSFVNHSDKLVNQVDKQPRPNKEVVKKEELPTPSPKRSKQNELWEALLKAGAPSPNTKTERSLFGKAVSELKQAGASAAEVERRVRAYRRKWPDMDFTVTALIKHWSLLGQTHDSRPPASAAHQPFKESREVCEHGNPVGRRCGDCYDESKVHRERIHALLHPEERI